MGLDLYHLKASDNQIKEDWFLHKDALPSSAFNEYNFSKFVNRKIVEDYFDRVAFFLSEEDRKQVKPVLTNNLSEHRAYDLFLVGTMEENTQELSNFEAAQSLVRNNDNISEETIIIKSREIKFKALMYKSKLDCEIIYYDEVGHQRKGMNADFYQSQYFANDEFRLGAQRLR